MICQIVDQFRISTQFPSYCDSLLRVSILTSKRQVCQPSSQPTTLTIRRKTALTKVVSDIVMAADASSVSLLALLDLIAAFDTVDHQILLIRLQTSHRIIGGALNWLKNYLEVRCLSVKCGNLTSPSITLSHATDHRVLQVLGPLLFLLYASNITQVISLHGLSCHCYVDNTQLYFHIRPGNTLLQKSRLENYSLRSQLANERPPPPTQL